VPGGVILLPEVGVMRGGGRGREGNAECKPPPPVLSLIPLLGPRVPSSKREGDESRRIEKADS